MNKREHLFEAIGLVDDYLIEEAADARRMATPWKKWVAMAACVVLVVGLGASSMSLMFRGCGAGVKDNTTSDAAAPVTEETTETTEGTAPEEAETTDVAEPEAAGDEGAEATEPTDSADQSGGNGAFESAETAAEVPVLGIYAGDGLTVERQTSMVVFNGGATVSDTYLLTNESDKELVVEMARPDAALNFTVDGVQTDLPEILTLSAGDATEIVVTLEVAATIDGDGLQSYALPTGTDSGLPLSRMTVMLETDGTMEVVDGLMPGMTEVDVSQSSYTVRVMEIAQ